MCFYVTIRLVQARVRRTRTRELAVWTSLPVLRLRDTILMLAYMIALLLIALTVYVNIAYGLSFTPADNRQWLISGSVAILTGEVIRALFWHASVCCCVVPVRLGCAAVNLFLCPLAVCDSACGLPGNFCLSQRPECVLFGWFSVGADCLFTEPVTVFVKMVLVFLNKLRLRPVEEVVFEIGRPL